MATKKTATVKNEPVKKAVVIKNAKTGEFVTKKHADTHPATTFTQTVIKPAELAPSKAKASNVKKTGTSEIKELITVLKQPQNDKTLKAIKKVMKTATTIDNKISKIGKDVGKIQKAVDEGSGNKKLRTPSPSTLPKEISTEAKAFIDRPAKLPLGTSESPIEQAAETFADSLAPKSKRNIANVNGTPTAKKVTRSASMASGRAEVKASAVQDAREIFDR